MRATSLLPPAAVALLAIIATALPTEHSSALSQLSPRDAFVDSEWWQLMPPALEKRRGGGGGGSRGGSSSSSSSSSSSGSSGSGRSGGSSSSSSSSSGSRGSSSSHRSSGGSRSQAAGTRSSSNSGGRTSSGSGSPKTFGSGAQRSYAGGAAVPYTAGSRSAFGLTPFLLPLGALAFFPGLWLYSVYAYPWHDHANVHNSTSNKNESIPVMCLCQEYSVCGCDENTNGTYVQDVFNNATATNATNGTYTAKIADVNGTRTLVINGTLDNGTTASGATSGAALHAEMWSGYWVMVAIVAWGVWM